jgi:hypothetical protein
MLNVKIHLRSIMILSASLAFIACGGADISDPGGSGPGDGVAETFPNSDLSTCNELTGIMRIGNLTWLGCVSDDLSKANSRVILDEGFDGLENFDFSNNMALSKLEFYKVENIGSVDLSNIDTLRDVSLYWITGLDALDLSGNSELNSLTLYDIKGLHTLNLSANTALTQVKIFNNTDIQTLLLPANTGLADSIDVCVSGQITCM